ncbi:MAG: hypothetical protein QOJ26_1244 [Thermoplasmata archaeon]|jgi:hypothetical protein|nr:hypothetical protein [Thermoplasmata archaeon]MEA3166372.1 hypothetical protein [Thermoplasmata archaeon]
MMNRDTLVGIVGSALLVAAMVVVFVYERNNAQAALGDDALVTHVGEASLSGSVAVGQSDSKTDHIAASGPANVTFHLTWTAGNGRDTLKITATPPVGSNLTAKSSQAENDGAIDLVVSIPADGESDGNWTIKVEFTQAAANPLPGGIPPPAGGMTDSTVSYKVAVAVA